MSWNPEESRRCLTHPVDGPVGAWVETPLTSTSTLRFSDASTIQRSLAETGFVVESLHGDWDRSPVGPGSPELIYVARRTGHAIGSPS